MKEKKVIGETDFGKNYGCGCSLEDVSGLQLLQEKILYSCTVGECRYWYLVVISEASSGVFNANVSFADIKCLESIYVGLENPKCAAHGGSTKTGLMLQVLMRIAVTKQCIET